MDVTRLGNAISLEANRTQKRLQDETQRLSSGLRINSAQDDPSGLAISESLRTLASGVDTGAANLQTAKDLLNVGDGALGTTTEILQRVRTLLVESNSDITSASDRGNIQSEINQLLQEINRISGNSTFNGKQLLDGSLSSRGAQAAQVVEHPPKADPLTGLQPPTQVTNADGLGNPGPLIGTPTVGNGVSGSYVEFRVTGYANPAIDPILGPVGPGDYVDVIAYGADAQFGPQIVATTAVPINAGPVTTSITNYSGSESILQFTLANLTPQDVGVAQTFQTIRDIPADGGQPLQISAGHVEGDVLPVGLPNVSVSALGIANVSVSPNVDITDGFNPPVPGNDSDTAATDALYRIDTALDTVNNARAQVGAQTVAVQSAIDNNDLQAVNITASESQIRDANLAAEASVHIKDQILTTVQSQLLKTVNLNASDVLQLFQGSGR